MILVTPPIQTLPGPVKSVSELKEWNFDGSSTGQAEGHNSDVFLRPAAIFPDPFRGGDNILVMAETYNNDGTPNKFNHRYECAKSMEAAKDQEPWVSQSNDQPTACRSRGYLVLAHLANLLVRLCSSVRTRAGVHHLRR